MDKKFSNLPLRKGVGVALLNKNNQIFVAKRIDNPKNCNFGVSLLQPTV